MKETKMGLEALQVEALQRKLTEAKRHIALADTIIEDLDKKVQSQDAMLRFLHTTVSSMRLVNRVRRMLKKLVPVKMRGILDEENCASDEIQTDLPYLYREPLIDATITNEIHAFSIKPLICIPMPLYNFDQKWLDAAIKSLQAQWYEHWELTLIVDRNSETKRIKNPNHPKIKLIVSKENQTIRGAFQEVVSSATGAYIALMDEKDALTPDALYEMVKTINATGAEFLYSDEDTLQNNLYASPLFKPDFSYDLLLSFNYIGRFALIKSDIFKQIDHTILDGGEGRFLDAYLKTIEQTDKIAHIPKILYHRRATQANASKNLQNKSIIQSHLDRLSIQAAISDGCESPFLDITYALPQPAPLVSIIIPTKDAINYLDACIHSIVTLSTYSNYEILILNNNSEKEETFAWFGQTQEKYPFIKVLEANYPFNWSKLNNHAIRVADGEVFIFLNNDIKIITPEWIERLASRALQPKVGTVGALLLFEDDTIQHSGVVAGLGHIYRACEQTYDHGIFISPMVTRNVLASTGACLAVSRKTIEDIGLFDEEYLIADSDIVLSLRAHEKGYRNVLDAGTKLYHYESKTRNNFVPESDLRRSRREYHPYRKNGDPFFNNNLTLIDYRPEQINLILRSDSQKKYVKIRVL